jgi:hypothetical protein
MLILGTEMDVDARGAKMKPVKRDTMKQKPGRIQKKIAKRKSKKSVVFADVKAKWKRQMAQKQKR